MKPITFENLRRLMGGGKKKKDKESSFKRSDSFKRISIRKSYLDRGGRKKQQLKRETSTQGPSSDSDKLPEARIPDRNIPVMKSIQEDEKQEENNSKIKKSESNEGPGQSVIAYGNWLRGVRVNETSVSSSGVRGCERTIIYVPASDDSVPPPQPPVIRQLSSSPVFRRKSPVLQRKSNADSPTLKRKESNDSAVEMFPWGDSVDVQSRSPLFTRRSATPASPPPSLIPDANDEMCSLSVSLGRIWMDAPLAMAPRSLELPRSGSQSALPAHNSLDSALKDRNPVISNRLQTKITPQVGRTLSSTSTATASTGLFSSKDSGFSFSISIPKLTDFTSNQAPSGRGFFRKKPPKPKLSVSRDGYFKRTSGALVEVRRNSVRRRSSKKKSARSSGRKKKQNKRNNLYKNDMYQVVVSRPARSLRALKLDPMIFVPPEKRKPSVRRKQSFKLALQEIRDYTVKDDIAATTCQLQSQLPDVDDKDSADDEGLYECISGEFDILSDETGASERVSHFNDHCYDRPSSELVKLSLSDDSPVSASASPISSDDENTSYKSSSGSTGSCYIPAGITPVKRKVLLRRKKSALSSKKPVTYVAKPNIMRASSTLRRSKKKKTSE